MVAPASGNVLVGRMPETIIVVPCYNEASRLDRDRMAELACAPGVELLFVDDGSTDDTLAVLQGMRGRTPTIHVHGVQPNQGKAEAVRQGLLKALELGATRVGYLDADLATPPEEALRLTGLLADHPARHAVIGARVALSGRNIDRDWRRHYTGRFFSTLASLVLRIVIYDTQCGAKFFRRTPALEAALRERFLSRWAFDIELLGRLMAGTPEIEPVPAELLVEEPLYVWTDVAGSKISLIAMIRTTLELWSIDRDLVRRRRLARTSRGG